MAESLNLTRRKRVRPPAGSLRSAVIRSEQTLEDSELSAEPVLEPVDLVVYRLLRLLVRTKEHFVDRRVQVAEQLPGFEGLVARASCTEAGR